VLLFSLLPTLLFIYTLEQFIVSEQELDYGVLLSGYLGIFLLGCCFAAIGIFTSSLTKNQVAAYVSAIFLNFFFLYAFESLAPYNLLGSADYYVQKIGFYVHYQQLFKGILETRDIIYFLVIIVLFLALTHFNLEKKK